MALPFKISLNCLCILYHVQNNVYKIHYYSSQVFVLDRLHSTATGNGKKVLKGIKNTQKQVFNHCTKRLQKKL